MAKKLSVNELALVSKPAAENKFCKLWPNARIALKAMTEMTKNFLVITIIGMVITTGDTIASTKCTT